MRVKGTTVRVARSTFVQDVSPAAVYNARPSNTRLTPHSPRDDEVLEVVLRVYSSPYNLPVMTPYEVLEAMTRAVHAKSSVKSRGPEHYCTNQAGGLRTSLEVPGVILPVHQQEIPHKSSQHKTNISVPQYTA